MNKTDLIMKIAKKSGLKNSESQKTINLVFEVMSQSLLEGDSINIMGFGSFKPVKREARIGRNPKTGEGIRIPEKILVKFSASKELKESLNN